MPSVLVAGVSSEKADVDAVGATSPAPPALRSSSLSESSVMTA